MAVAAHRDLDPGPVVPDAADDVAQDPRRLGAGWPLARTQQRQHRLAGRRVEVGNQITLASGALLTLNADGSYAYNPNGQFESLRWWFE